MDVGIIEMITKKNVDMISKIVVIVVFDDSQHEKVQYMVYGGNWSSN